MADTKEQERSKLAQFASAPQHVMPSAGMSGQIIEHSRGAIKVAVKRDLQEILKNLTVLAQMAGESYYYRFPARNKDGTTSYIEGISINGALAVAREYGNCDVDCRSMDMGDRWLYYARYTDLETGFSITRPFEQRQDQKTMGGDAGRQRDIAFQIGASKAIRNVINNANRDVCDFVLREAKNSIVEKIGKNLPKNREAIADRLIAEGIDVKRAERVIGRTVGQWLAPDIARVVAMLNAVKDGMADVNESFPPIDYKKEAAAEAAEAKTLTETAAENEAGDGAERPAGAAEAAPVDPAPTAGPDGEKAADAAPTPEEMAEDMGAQARLRGVGYKVVPQDYRDDPALLAAWQRGWKEQDARTKTQAD